MEPRSTTAPGVDGELMPQRQVLEHEISAGADRSEECCDKQTEVEHRRASRGSPILCYLRTELHLSGFAVPRGMQRGGRKRAVLEPDEYPASRTSVDTGHDPHLRHAGTAARPPAAAPAGPGPPMAPPIRVPETHGGGRPGSGIMVSEGLPPLTPLTAGSGGQPATPGRERRSTAYPGYWRERGSDAHIHEDELR